MTQKLYVGNLPFSLGEEELKILFEDHGRVSSVLIIKHGRSGKSKGFGFIEMEQEEGAEAAVENLNGNDYEGRIIKVDFARPVEERKKRFKSKRPKKINKYKRARALLADF